MAGRIGAAESSVTPKQAAEARWDPRERFLGSLVKLVPEILRSQNRETGRFGTEPWICDYQNVILSLAAAWAIQDAGNPYFRDSNVLEAIMKGGDALVDAQDKNGLWTFRKKDNSTWGQRFMPWIASAWIGAFQVIKDAMPTGRRQQWERGLMLGFSGVSKNDLTYIHNLPAQHATALYCAGRCLGRDDWQEQVRVFMSRIVAAQSPGGWWSEHSGPVVGYGFVYCESLGVYYAMSRDEGVLEALRRAAVFHAALAYPDGGRVETVDERNPLERGVMEGNVGFSFTPEGRGFLLRQYQLRNWSANADAVASFLLYGGEGDAVSMGVDRADSMTIIGNNEALVLRHEPWFICVSAFTCEQPTNRWQQDRQNFFSIFHDRTGLVAGGGNTKLQPFWSNFTVGDTSLLQHRVGDENPDFKARGDLVHIPSSARLRADKATPGLDLTYGSEECRLTLHPMDENRLTIVCEATCISGQRVEGHLTFMPHVGAAVTCASGRSITLSEETFDLPAVGIGAWFEHGGCHVSVPAGARLVWPRRAHNPYKKDGGSTLAEARLVLCLPFSHSASKQEITLEITKR